MSTTDIRVVDIDATGTVVRVTYPSAFATVREDGEEHPVSTSRTLAVSIGGATRHVIGMMLSVDAAGYGSIVLSEPIACSAGMTVERVKTPEQVEHEEYMADRGRERDMVYARHQERRDLLARVRAACGVGKDIIEPVLKAIEEETPSRDAHVVYSQYLRCYSATATGLGGQSNPATLDGQVAACLAVHDAKAQVPVATCSDVYKRVRAMIFDSE